MRSEPRVYADRRILKNEHISVHFDEHGHISSLKLKGVQQLEAGSLIPHIRYGEQRLSPKHLKVTVEECGTGGSASIRIHGPWQGPAGITRSPGWVDYRLRLVDDTPYLFIKGRVRYPDTFRHDVVSAEKPMLARKIDTGWQEVAPLELRFSPRATQERPFLIHKRNYLGREASYALDYYRHSPDNLNLDSINNHITAEYTGVTNGMQGLAVAVNTAVRANFAFCPFKLVYLTPSDRFQIRANPFGTYHGDQIVPPTHGNHLGFEAVLLSAPQFNSAAPTYNGYSEQFELMLAFFNGDAIPETVKRDLVSFSRQPLILGIPDTDPPNMPQSPFQPPAGFMALPYQDGILFHWESVATADTQYRISWRSLQENQEKTITVRGNTWFQPIDRLNSSLKTVAAMDGAYAATIQALLSDGRRSPISEEIRFRPDQSMDHDFNIPNHFKAKIVWANVRAWIHNYLL
jgi:hypothetical protein